MLSNRREGKTRYKKGESHEDHKSRDEQKQQDLRKMPGKRIKALKPNLLRAYREIYGREDEDELPFAKVFHIYIQMWGPELACVLGFLVNWFKTKTRPNPEGKFYLTGSDMEEQTSLNRFQQRRVLNKLQSLGLIDMWRQRPSAENKKGHTVRWISIQYDEIVARIERAQKDSEVLPCKT